MEESLELEGGCCRETGVLDVQAGGKLMLRKSHDVFQLEGMVELRFDGIVGRKS